jgi:hypothetical protein
LRCLAPHRRLAQSLYNANEESTRTHVSHHYIPEEENMAIDKNKNT